MFNIYRTRRNSLMALLAAGAIFSSSPLTALAADYPSRPIKIVVAFGPGGLSDLTTREIARLMSVKLGQPVLVENKPSAGQVVGMQTVFNAAPDGYTLLLGSTTGFSIAPQMFRNMNLEPARFVPVGPISTTPNVLIALPDFPANNLKDLKAYAKTRKDPFTYGSIGIGTTTHLGMEIFRKGAGFEATHVPYKGDAPALLALKSREVDTAVITLFSAQARIKSGEVKAIGVFQSSPPVKDLPAVQTVTQAGAPDADLPSWVGLFAPPNTPKAVIAKLEPVLREAVASPSFQEFLVKHGGLPMDLDNKQFLSLIAKQSAQLGGLVRSLNLQPE